jgi:hypothetical protein
VEAAVLIADRLVRVSDGSAFLQLNSLGTLPLPLESVSSLVSLVLVLHVLALMTHPRLLPLPRTRVKRLSVILSIVPTHSPARLVLQLYLLHH